MQKDLEFIRSVVKEWPEGATSVRLDYDGEICFGGSTSKNDFFPSNERQAIECFTPDSGFFNSVTGERYTFEQWAGEE